MTDHSQQLVRCSMSKAPTKEFLFRALHLQERTISPLFRPEWNRFSFTIQQQQVVQPLLVPGIIIGVGQPGFDSPLIPLPYPADGFLVGMAAPHLHHISLEQTITTLYCSK